MNSKVAKVINEVKFSRRTRPHWNLFTATKNRMASSLDSNPALLDRLSRKFNASVQQRVAENRSANSQTLDRLSQHESSDVRAAIAQNGNTLEATAVLLSQDVDCDVRYAIAANPRTRKEILSELAEDENPFVQHRARQTQDRIEAEPSPLLPAA
jgi:hypothetical protein